MWDLVSNFILVTGMKMEELISLNNGMKYNVRFRWQVIQVIVSLNDLPEAFEEAKADDQRIDKQEAIEIIGQILKKSIPEILNLAEDGYNRGMDISTFINAVTGQFGALVLACVVLYNFMQQQKTLYRKTV